jgi:hypothetical protein
MSYVKNGLKQILATETMGFRHEAGGGSNRTTTFLLSILNIILIEGSTERITVPMFTT